MENSMKYRKFSKQEKKEEKSQAVREAMSGEGLYLYENNSDATLTLPKPTDSGTRIVDARKQFQGDNYYMQMVMTGHLKLIRELQAPKKEEQIMNEEKLILDQPDMVTDKGKMEHIVETPTEPINEQGDEDNQEDVLLNEDPVDGGFVIVE